jgi:hypothetical protein
MTGFILGRTEPAAARQIGIAITAGNRLSGPF